MVNKSAYLIIIILAHLLIFSATASASIVISQVLYDPVGTESGGEAVQLKNTGTTPTSVSGWTLRTATSAVDATLPDDAVIGPESTYLIADIGWSTLKDDASWADADTEQSLTMKNSDSGVALFNGTQKIDAVGWGAPDDPLLFEGTAAAPVESGHSLFRTQDTDDNAADFVDQPASFAGRGSSQMTQQLPISVTVTASTFEIISTALADDDPTASGYQLIPSPGTDRRVPVTVQINSTSPVSLEAVFGSQHIVFIEESPGIFTGTFTLSSALFPGTYTLDFTAATAQEQLTWTQDFEVMGVVAFSLSAESIDFGNLSTSEESLQQITIANLGNIALDLGVDGTDLASGDSVLSLDHLTVHYDELDDPGKIVPITSLPQVLNTDILPHHNATIGIGIHIPSALASGTYQGILTLLGVGN